MCLPNLIPSPMAQISYILLVMSMMNSCFIFGRSTSVDHFSEYTLLMGFLHGTPNIAIIDMLLRL